MIFLLIFNFGSLTLLLANVNNPEDCFKISYNIWNCIIQTNNAQISCLQMEESFYFNKITIQLKVKNLAEERYSPFFKNNCNIIRLKVEANQIPSNSLIKNLKSLELLIIQNFQHSVFETTTGIFDNLLLDLNNVEVINIEGYKLKLWGKDIFQSCLKVTKIVLKNLGIKSIDFQSFSNCKILKILSIQSNEITTLITSSFSGIIKLTDLILSSNGIVDIVTNGHGWDNLEHLDKLDLSNNTIKKLTTRLFYGLVGLSELNLMDNDLNTISTDAFFGLYNLKILNLKENSNLLSLDLNVLYPLKNTLTMLHIDANKMHCLYNKKLRLNYVKEIKLALDSIITCNMENIEDNYKRSTIIRKITYVSTESLISFTQHIYNSEQMSLILTVTILIVVLIFILIFCIIYCVTSRIKIKKYKSLNNSFPNSRTDTLLHQMVELPGTYRNKYTENEDTYGIFEKYDTSRNSIRK